MKRIAYWFDVLFLAGFVAFATPARAEQNPAAEPVSVVHRVNDTLNSQTSLARYVVNECVLAGVASVAIAMSISGGSYSVFCWYGPRPMAPRIMAAELAV